MDRPRFLLDLEAQTGDPAGPTPAQRLRAMLKSALRRHGLKCLRAVELRADHHHVGTEARAAAPPADLGMLCAELAGRAGDLGVLLTGLSLPADVADRIGRQLRDALQAVEDVSAGIVEAGPL